MSKLSEKIKHNREIDPSVKTDIMRYVNNKTSFWLCILAICLDVAMFITIYHETNCKANFQLGLDLLINVMFLLACFLLSERTKAYNRKAGISCFVIAGIQIVRIFWIPLYYFNCNKKYLAAVKAAEEAGEILSYSGTIGLSAGQFTSCVILLVLSALSLVIAGYVCIVKEKKLVAHLKEQQERGN